jgi:2-keto-4-pentenoate hydratase/2-oxohepta-3-ene-1,7-dioic acid hydratase in catechol pathway
MKIATFDHGGTPAVGLVDDTRLLDLDAGFRRLAGTDGPRSMIELIAGGRALLDRCGEVLERARRQADDSGLWHPLAATRLLAPIPRPAKNVFCVGRNYKLHIEEGARARGVPPAFPSVPEFFSKPPTTVIGPQAEIRLDATATQQLDYEVELAMVIGTSCRDLTARDAGNAVFGYTIVNDVTARDAQKAHGQWFKGKGMDTFCPIGPWIVTADSFGDPGDHRITLRVNGDTRQDSTTSDMLFDCGAILQALSRGLTLEPGDIIATGTPSGVALGMSPQQWLRDGDVVEAEIEGIGVLGNTVRALRR